MSDRFQLLGGEVSYFTGKARAYLRYKDIPYDEILATREVYRSIILPRVGWPVIPVVITPEDETLQDTTDIIDALEERFPAYPVYPATPKQRLAALLLEVYGDEWLVLPAMHYRWNYCYEWTVLEFGKLSRPELPEDEQRAIGERNAKNFAGSLPFLGVNDDTHEAIEISYRALLADLEEHFRRHAFVLGSRPSIGDLGLIGPLYAHLYRDPHPGRLMRREAPSVAAWVERMQHPEPLSGEFLHDDEVPETLLPVLRRMADEHLPVLVDAAAKTADWLETHEGEEIPRGIGRHSFTLLAGTGSEVTSERLVRPFSLWMFQRPVDFYHSLGGEALEACSGFLDSFGGLEALQQPIRRRVRRHNFKLVAA